MTINLSDTLVVGISATALFDLSEADKVFRAKFDEDRDTAVNEYRDYMLAREDDDLDDGTGLPLVKALLELNMHEKNVDSPLIEVVVMSRNSPETGIRVLKNIRSRALEVSRHAFTGGESVVDYLEAFDVDLFLTTNVKDAQRVIDGGNCAVAIVKKPPGNQSNIKKGQVRIAFDGDAVLFDASELVYKSDRLKQFQENEDQNQDTPFLKDHMLLYSGSYLDCKIGCLLV